MGAGSRSGRTSDIRTQGSDLLATSCHDRHIGLSACARCIRTLCTLGAIPYMGLRGSQFKDSNGGVLSVCLLGFEIPVVMRSLV